ncbi:CvfB family protein [Riemerella columbipharyngis]|uniref:RNA-binding protein n=1 Tax=Riemerella columbipharyngis TaxID=1071918 RepID=A0A1G6ZJS8_9FLAO|nr:S1-like domain-containing RNA-binding protein [Riemerella columbipharyngis]SDE02878.1 hypothetical protein SAMN05421544_102110 [Riemerella columbipharyngis]
MEIGKIQLLKYIRKTSYGVILQNEKGEECILPNIFVEEKWEEGEEIEVFVYQDDGKLFATTEIPYCEAGEYAALKCVQVLSSGAFVDLGIIKDLFVPYKQQKGKMQEGKRYIIYVYVDEETGLLTGTTKFKRNPQYENLPLKKGQQVDLLMMNETELGWNVIINKKYIGLIYASDVYEKIYPLSEKTGYIKNIREDHKIDVSLQPEGFQNIDEFKQRILDKLDENYGILYLSDKSSPEEIKAEVHMSKKNFKKAIGGLYKEKVIEILEDKIRLL